LFKLIICINNNTVKVIVNTKDFNTGFTGNLYSEKSINCSDFYFLISRQSFQISLVNSENTYYCVIGKCIIDTGGNKIFADQNLDCLMCYVDTMMNLKFSTSVNHVVFIFDVENKRLEVVEVIEKKGARMQESKLYPISIYEKFNDKKKISLSNNLQAADKEIPLFRVIDNSIVWESPAKFVRGSNKLFETKYFIKKHLKMIYNDGIFVDFISMFNFLETLNKINSMPGIKYIFFTGNSAYSKLHELLKKYKYPDYTFSLISSNNSYTITTYNSTRSPVNIMVVPKNELITNILDEDLPKEVLDNKLFTFIGSCVDSMKDIKGSGAKIDCSLFYYYGDFNVSIQDVQKLTNEMRTVLKTVNEYITFVFKNSYYLLLTEEERSEIEYNRISF
jgi:hypothetical protein